MRSGSGASGMSGRLLRSKAVCNEGSTLRDLDGGVLGRSEASSSCVRCMKDYPLQVSPDKTT